ncbi:protein FAM136A-like [Babylonia areolata]|uniref:protein FAM136A-like n=1 Tax=Babylonia areolata TaxID=304850 RepID=UPI003FCFD43A
MDGAQARVRKAVDSMVSSLDKDCLRDLQAEMYRCSTKCCEDKTTSLDEVQNCIERCSSKVSRAQNYVQNEIQMFQDRLQRCVMSCDDNVRPKIGPSTTDEERTKLFAEVEACAVKCADQHASQLSGQTKNILENLRKNRY